jgi:hypothetical protein
LHNQAVEQIFIKMKMNLKLNLWFGVIVFGGFVGNFLQAFA